MVKQAFFRTIFFLIPFYLLSIAVLAQQKYWLEFNYEHLNDRQTAIQLLQNNLKKEYSGEIKFLYQSKWHPVVSVLMEESTALDLKNHNLVKTVSTQKVLQSLSVETLAAFEYSYALEQIKAYYLTDSMGLSGKNVKIGVIDGGFMDADSEPSLKKLVENEQIKFFKDYLLQGNTDPFYGKRIARDDHGTQVLKMIAGVDSGTSLQFGMAINADFYLARTDHGIREKRVEEDYWVEAIELFYDMGIRLVNSSLGYTDGFDSKKENHSRKEVDGKSSMITRTAQMAAEKGMLIVSSAGNDGNSKWETLSLPSDAKDILTVGAVRFDDWSKIYYSSIGPDQLDYVKPDVAVFGANGTSFSAPVITGLAACIWEYDSTLSNLDVMNIIKKSSHLHQKPNNYIGHGVPDSEKIMEILEERYVQFPLEMVSTKLDFIKVAIPKTSEKIVIFHKIDQNTVIEQESILAEEGQKDLKIMKIEKAKYSTIVAQDKPIIEVEWE